jgi:hypothetical protein
LLKEVTPFPGPVFRKVSPLYSFQKAVTCSQKILKKNEIFVSHIAVGENTNRGDRGGVLKSC